MRKALVRLLRNQSADSSDRTMKALASRGLLVGDSELTSSGRREALRFVPLEEKCEFLDLTLQEIKSPCQGRTPEIALWESLVAKGYIGTYCEGGAILILLRAAALDVLAKLNTFESRSDACTRFTEAQFSILATESQQIVEEIRGSDIDRIVRNFDEIYSHDFVRSIYPSLSTSVVAELFCAVGSEPLARVASALIEDPYTLRSGWPDLTMLRERELRWIEVKTTDKLHLNQIRTIEHMAPLLPGEFSVVRLVT